jgi:hypothetical protein
LVSSASRATSYLAIVLIPMSCGDFACSGFSPGSFAARSWSNFYGGYTNEGASDDDDVCTMHRLRPPGSEMKNTCCQLPACLFCLWKRLPTTSILWFLQWTTVLERAVEHKHLQALPEHFSGTKTDGSYLFRLCRKSAPI